MDVEYNTSYMNTNIFGQHFSIKPQNNSCAFKICQYNNKSVCDKESTV